MTLYSPPDLSPPDLLNKDKMNCYRLNYCQNYYGMRKINFKYNQCIHINVPPNGN